jgi:hypothetical protein
VSDRVRAGLRIVEVLTSRPDELAGVISAWLGLRASTTLAPRLFPPRT